jgi:hypothetical protein
MEPPVSKPSAARHIPPATVIADPAELPPGEQSELQGLRLAPNTLVSDVKL